MLPRIDDQARGPGAAAAVAGAVLLLVLLAAQAGAQSPTVASVKTVGLDPAQCASNPSIVLPPEGGNVTYCYTLTNTGDVAFSTLDLVDSELGALITSLPYTLAPGASVSVTETAFIATTTTNVAGWTASVAPSTAVSSTSSALVTVTPAAPGLSFVKTVGTDPAACAPTSSIALPVGGGTVVYCYSVTNTGNISLTSHDLVDSELGALLTDFAYALTPASSVFVTASSLITQTTLNTATWMASSITPTAAITSGSSALVTVAAPSVTINLVKTVGADPDVCAPTGELALPEGGGTAVYCYEVTNTGNVTLDVHDLVDDQLGSLLTSFPYTLAPGASVFITQAATITATTVNSATWTASGVGVGQATASGQALVTVGQVAAIPMLSRSMVLAFLLLVCAAGLLAIRRLA